LQEKKRSVDIFSIIILNKTLYLLLLEIPVLVNLIYTIDN